MRTVYLSLPSLGERTFLLRDLTGNSELLAEPEDPFALSRLLSQILYEPSGESVDQSALFTSWRDRIAAALFTQEFGDALHCQSRCNNCHSEYEFDFQLSAVLEQQSEVSAKLKLALDDSGCWPTPSGAFVRPPTLGDLATHSDPAALRKALVVKGKVSAKKLDVLLEEAAPLLSLDLASQCPDCEEDQKVSFNIDRYLIESLATERPFLLREVHLIASRYSWTHDVILALPRRDRRAFAGMIESERSQALNRRAS